MVSRWMVEMMVKWVEEESSLVLGRRLGYEPAMATLAGDWA
jgi:hypothetical protein